MNLNFYMLTQDHRIQGALKPLGVREHMRAKEADLSQNNLQFLVEKAERVVEVDFIEKPIPLMSDRLKQLIEKFSPKLKFQPAGLMNLEKGEQYWYWLASFPKVACLSAASEFHLNGTMKRIVIDTAKAGNHPIFQLESPLGHYIVVNLMLAESMLRRDFTGLKLTSVEQDP